jgi:hypothetical protein
LRLPVRFPLIVQALVSGLACLVCAAVAADELSFRREAGHTLNSFRREGEVAAHLILRGGHRPRLLVAFPAGDSGVALWFAPSETDLTWYLLAEPKPTVRADARGHLLRGITADVAVDADALHVAHTLLSSVRVLRNYEIHQTEPVGLSVSPIVQTGALLWQRDRLDGAPGYAIEIKPLSGTRLEAGATLRGTRHRISFELVALTGEPPLHPLAGTRLLSPAAGPDQRARQVLTFLSYREKYLAGSWRFATYFGRDTLLTLDLLAPALSREALQGSLVSVLERLSAAGEVAHEESIGEFAILTHRQAGERLATPVYDYSMIDEDFLLAPLAARILLEVLRPEQARAFLATPAADGHSYGALLVRNLLWVAARVRPFAAEPSWRNLIALKSGQEAGNWRDSPSGLGGGRYPYDVNVALVPAALQSSAQLLASHVLDAYVSPVQHEALSHLRDDGVVWSRAAARFFAITISAESARSAIAHYAADLGLDPQVPLAAVAAPRLMFDALALDSAGRPIPVMHSDGGFVLLFGTPDAAQLSEILQTLMRPFPAGLYTPVGLLVSNPVFATAPFQGQFTRTAYHGTVVWSWQQALLAAGIERQLRRGDLPPESRELLRQARRRLWTAIDNVMALRESELWSWSLEQGCYRVEAFGSQANDADESDAAQLWSTAFLAIPAPERVVHSMGLPGDASATPRPFCERPQ